ncbi:tetratricopeptide repeat protein [Formosa sediminum]|uniref:Tetratricopeptide repeat protein n=1 Tax=Formosa sediminum TaxID=2594004 RepID=A0A516GPA8_9FLAO|nr:tetratricopeptide repeat protein [Formosa sediminum]QDO93339.1 tetratricopeptide repeat protein [Formosa sediminum]
MKILFVCCMLLSVCLFSQENQDYNTNTAQLYFKNGDFEKALISYKKLVEESPTNTNYILALVKTYQQLEQFQEAELFLTQTLNRIKHPSLFIELGYNYQLQDNLTKANENYEIALASIDTNISYVYTVSKQFESHSLLDFAIRAYEKAMALNSEADFTMQLSRIYGEQGNIEKMFSSYIDFIEHNPIYKDNIKRIFSDFLSEDPEYKNNSILRKTILKKIQQNPDLIWNELLSWLFSQQNEFNKAFAQEKAIYNRLPESLNRMEDLAALATNEKDFETATNIYNYIIETTQETDTKLRAHYNLLTFKTQLATEKEYKTIQSDYLNLFETYGTLSQTLELQVAYGHFLAFNLHDIKTAEAFLKQTLKLKLKETETAKVKLELADILVLQEKFNEALIYYTQIQRSLKNSTISQEARFRVARTSYYKGDFKWAESQLNILKQSTSQLIANDALALKLLISDNKYEDSTQTALKLYAKADLLAYQNKPTEAITVLDTLLANHGAEPIAEQALYKQAKLFSTQHAYIKAEQNYLLLINNYTDGLLADDAYFNLAELYNKQLNEPEKAKPLYEHIIFNFADSIYFVEARSQFRTLRGDAINQ